MAPRSVVFASESRLGTLVALGIRVAGAALSPVRHRLFWRVTKLLGSLVRGRGEYRVILVADDGRMKVFLDDPYWAQLLAPSYAYEADFRRVLLGLRDVDYAFVDCGANFGYWSILASGRALGSKPVIAVEAAASTFRVLQENSALNDDRFACRLAAVSSRSGQLVAIATEAGHADARVIEGEPTQGGNVVETITLDDLVLGAFGRLPERTVVKLDVEGQEIAALKGASGLFERDVLLYYEDHGHDPHSEVTEFVLTSLGLRVFFVPAKGPVREILTARDASAVKSQASRGYNFFACLPGSPFLGPVLATTHQASA